MELEHHEKHMYGRSALLDSLEQESSPVVLVTGDSGVGKSTVLAAASHTEARRFTTNPVELHHSEGALKDGLLRSLADGLVELESSQGGLERLRGYLSNALERIMDAGPTALGEVVVRELAEMVKGRLGPHVGEATRDFFKEFRDENPSVSARIAAARDPNLSKVITGLLDDINVVAGNAGVVISLDRGELLDDSDWRLLADIAEALQTPLQIRLAVSLSSASVLAEIERLAALPSVGRIEVPGLSLDAVRLWMADHELDPKDAQQVWRVTRGYAFYVADALARIESGLALGDLSLSDQVKMATEHEWDQLDIDVRTAARKLSVLAEPLPENDLQALCGTDKSKWQELVRALMRARIFTTSVEGVPWFHELRRRHIEQTLLDRDERRSLAAMALLRLVTLVTESDDISRTRELGRLMVAASGDPSLPSDLAGVGVLDRDELRLAGALIEISDPRLDQGAVVADQLIMYARRLFPEEGDLTEAVERLAQRRELVVFESNERVAVLVPSWSRRTLAAVMGRISYELNHLPIPALATAFFELTLRHRLGRFEAGSYGIGNPGMASILRPIQRPITGEDGVVVLRDYEEDPVLITRFRVGGRTLYAGVRYLDSHERASATLSLENLPWRFLDEPVEVVSITPQPEGRVPYLLLSNALALIDGVEREFDSHGRGVSPTNRGEPFNGDYGAVKYKVIQAVREMATEHERRAFDLEEPVTIITAEDADTLFEYQVRGGVGGFRSLTSEPIGFGNDPYWTYRIAAMLDLRPDQKVVKVQVVHGSYRSRDPIVEAIADLAERARGFNKTQPRFSVRYKLDQLTSGIQSARRRERTLAHHIVEALKPLGRELSLLPPRRLKIYLGKPQEYGPNSFWGPGCWWVEYPSTSGDEEVTVEWKRSDQELSLWGEDMEDSQLRSGMGVSVYQVVQWLGYTDDDANLTDHLRFPSERS